MANRSSATQTSTAPASARTADLSGLSLAELRLSRRNARSQLEVAQLRARQALDADGGPIERLKAMVDHLTDELISRYERDPGLIDLILSDPPAERERRS